MEMHQLRYFVAVAETGSFSRAAARCHVSQPSLSQQVIKLERKLGQRLFNRLGRSITLTDAGELLLEHATSILTEAEHVEHRIRDRAQTDHGKLCVGAIPTVAPYLLPAAVEAFRRRYPEIEVTIQEDLTRPLIAATVAREVDFAVVALPIADARLHIEPLATESLLLAMPRDHRLAKRRRVKLAELSTEPFILLNEMHCLGEQVTRFCRGNAFEPKICCRSAQLSTMLGLIAAGQGISLIPEMARAADRSTRRVYRTIADDPPSRSLAIVWHKRHYISAAMSGFISELKKKVGG